MKNGVLVIDKPSGFTSHDIVSIARRALKTKKIGHTGTLDPDATGILVLCVGKATKLVPYGTAAGKTYETTLKLGTRTDTYDKSGEVIDQSNKLVSSEDVINVINTFIGEQKQIPPMYSAIKIDGKKLYDLARRGITVEREARNIAIYNIYDIKIFFPHVSFVVECSSGTYIRSLIDDIGQKLGTWAHMVQLRRTSVGNIGEDLAISVETLKEFYDSEDVPALIPMEVLVEHIPVKQLDSLTCESLLNGQWIPINNAENGETFRLQDDKELLGILEVITRDGKKYLKIKRGLV
ncbi:MAG: tRNA pseudouridine(55) synthase TruB [Tissierellia bacterium]|nr:tRNA pseudouridine(55) synthase TruB [Tissierellia bacterium]